MFGQSVLAQGFALANAQPIVADRVILVLQVESQHIFRFSDVFTGFGVTFGIPPK